MTPETQAGRELAEWLDWAGLRHSGIPHPREVDRIEAESATRALTDLRDDIKRRMAETQAWIDAHPVQAPALNAVNGAAIAAFHEVIRAIDDAIAAQKGADE